MFRPQEGLFAFRLRRPEGRDLLEGISGRYTAIGLIGLATESEAAAAEALHGHSPLEICGRLLQRVQDAHDLGEVALTLWAARRLMHPRAEVALKRLQLLAPAYGDYPTVEVSWALTSLCVPSEAPTDLTTAERIADRLLASFSPHSELFPHWSAAARSRWLRGHVCCFADLVYPVQALSWYYRATARDAAIEAARRCAARMCRLQGLHGQWWWHYDVRSGQVVERYPVYAVHQDGMGPMALLALEDAGGGRYRDPIRRSVAWLMAPPELNGSLVDEPAGVIWRKVARREPGKLVRGWQAVASSLHPELRVPGMDLLFPPGRVDYETRPYHMGWLLHAFTAERVADLAGSPA